MRILITAGPTREPIDPVRFISNYSTGTFGYEIARAAVKDGHSVTLVSGPAHLKPPRKVKLINVNTANEMFVCCKDNFKKTDCIVMAAAVSDFRPSATKAKKIKRRKRSNYILRLRQNKDILAYCAAHKKNKIAVGFCMETEGLACRAAKKMRSKNLDIIVANKINAKKSAFGKAKTSVLILSADDEMVEIKNTSKTRIASILLDKIEALWYKRNVKCKIENSKLKFKIKNFAF